MSEICIGGMVLETNMSEILVHVDAQTKVEKSESSPTSTIKVNERYIYDYTRTLLQSGIFPHWSVVVVGTNHLLGLVYHM